MPTLRKRHLEPEIMDDPSLDAEEHARALRGLARVHALTRTGARLWKQIQKHADQAPGETLTILDVGCGDALLLRQIHARAKKARVSLRLIGCDFSERALELARAASRAESPALEFTRVDVLNDALPNADIVICSLFLHHFSNEQIVAVLSKFAESARRAVIIEDLIRSQLGYLLCWVGVHALTRSPVVHTDGLLSVRAALTLDEIKSMLTEAGLAKSSQVGSLVVKHWPERFLVSWAA